ncbi:hypothetical protein LRP88_03744 [Fusarium phalaenopsidis]
MSEQKNDIMPALREPSGDGGRTTEKVEVDSEDQMHHTAPPTEAIRKIWTKSPLIVAFSLCYELCHDLRCFFCGSLRSLRHEPFQGPFPHCHGQYHPRHCADRCVSSISKTHWTTTRIRRVGDKHGPSKRALRCVSQRRDLSRIFESFGDTWWTINEQIFIAEVTSLMNRGFLFTLPESLAAIPTLYAGTYLGEHMLLKSSWRWGFGMWAAIMPFCALPTIAIMVFMEFRARKKGIYYKRVSLRAASEIPEGASWTTKVRQVLFVQLDIVGAFMLLAGLSMTLLPLSITGRRNTESWTEPSSIVLLAVGVLTFVGFLVWDGRYAKKPIVPFQRLHRAFYKWLEVTRLDMQSASSKVALNLGGLVIGLAIRFVKHTKPFIVLGFLMVALANGLPIYFTNIDGALVANEAALTTGQVLLGLGRGFVQVPLQVALQAAVPDHEIGIATAIIGGALWNTLLPRRLAANLPEVDKANSTVIFRSIVAAQSYEPGTATRDAIDLSYRLTQQTLAIGSLSLSIPLLIIMFFFRNVKLEKEDEKRNEVAEQQLAAAGQGLSAGQNTVTEKS